jgi:predicted PurR-regulated permease PerM
METSRKIYIFLLVITGVLLLIYAQVVIIPFILALLFWYLIRVIKKLLIKIKFLDRVPNWVMTIVSSLFLLSFVWLIINMIMNNIQQITENMPLYQNNIIHITNGLNSRFNIDMATIFQNFAKNFEFASILTGVLAALTGLFGNAVTILLYLVFLLLEEHIFPKKLVAMYPHKHDLDKITMIIGKIDKSISNYIALKTIISLCTGILSYFALLFIGVDAPAFWAFIIFVLNFIPTIGSLIATVFPAIFALLQFGQFKEGLLILGIVGSIQLVVGNFVEPKLMGNSLNISPLVVLLTLAIWGVMWGITGMLLSVPVTVIMIIVMAEFPSTRPFAILLSQDGKINTDEVI